MDFTQFAKEFDEYKQAQDLYDRLREFVTLEYDLYDFSPTKRKSQRLYNLLAEDQAEIDRMEDRLVRQVITFFDTTPKKARRFVTGEDGADTMNTLTTMLKEDDDDLS